MIKLYKPFKEDFRISQHFGENPDVYSWIKDVNGNPIKGHNGVDFGYGGNNAVELHNPFPSRHDVVISKVSLDANGYGWYIRIWDKTQKFVILMAHGKSVLIDEWQSVEKGELVMIGNNTGWSTGPHLHIAGYYVNESGEKLNRSNGYDGFVDLLDPAQFQWMDEVKTWKEYFSFDVTKALQEDVWVGLNFSNAMNFPRTTALDSIAGLWNELYNAALKVQGENTRLVTANGIMSKEKDTAVKAFTELEIKYNKLKIEKNIDLKQAVEFIIDYFKKKWGEISGK